MKRISRSESKRNLLVGLVMSVLFVAGLAGPAPASAEPAAGTGFLWGPAATQEEMRSPLNDGMVLDALDMAVDEDSISARVLGQSSLLVFVYDASQPDTLEMGSTTFDPEGAKATLKAQGITSVTLTIAADVDVPEAGAIAEAIAADLRTNIGAQVTVVNGQADLLVTGAAPPPTPVPTLSPETVAFEHTCTPDTLRPGEWVVIECVARTTNTSQATLTDVGWSIGATFDGPIPTSFFVWSKRDGEFQPLSTYTLSYGGYDLSPGQTVETHTVLLLRMSEGTFTTEAVLSAGGRQGLARPIRFVATKDAADPPAGLVVTEELVGGPTDGEAVPTATYETRITNRGSSAATKLTVTDRYDEYASFVGGEPAPSTRNPAVQLASWDLAAFGKDSLAPGESLVLRTTYGPGSGSDCSDVTPGIVVEAMVDGQERLYGARAEDSATVGKCDYDGNTGGGRGGGEWGVGGGGGGFGVVAAPSSGEGPDAAEGDGLWAAMVLAGGGLALVAAAQVMRRRSER